MHAKATAIELYRYATVDVYWRYYKLHWQPNEIFNCIRRLIGCIGMEKACKGSLDNDTYPTVTPGKENPIVRCYYIHGKETCNLGVHMRTS